LRNFRKATIKEVAAQAAVSTTTVSLYVSGRRQVCSAETGERIERAVSALSYTPSSLTRGLRRRTSSTIGVCITNPMDPGVAYGQPFFERMWRGVMHQADLDNYALLRYPSALREIGKSDLFLDGRVDGMLLHTHDDKRPMELAAAGMPLVLLTRSRHIAPCCGFVHADEELTTDLAMGHLWELGHRRIAYISGPVGNLLPVRGMSRFGFFSDDVAVARLEAYIEWTSRRGVYDPSLIVPACDWIVPKSEALLKVLINNERPPTAIFCANDCLALDMMKAAKESGLRIPGDVSIVGVDNTPQSRENGAELTTIAVDVEEIGREALRALLRLMRDESPERYRVSLPVSTLVVRGTTAEVPS